MNAAELIRQFFLDCCDIYKKELSPSIVQRYIETLSELPVSRLRYAFREALKSQFLPNAGDIWELAESMPADPAAIEAARQRLIETRVDFNAKALPSYLDEPEEFLKLAAPSDAELQRLAQEVIDERPIRRKTEAEQAAWLAELERQKQILLAQAAEEQKHEKPQEKPPEPETPMIGEEGWVM